MMWKDFLNSFYTNLLSWAGGCDPEASSQTDEQVIPELYDSKTKFGLGLS